MDGGRLTIECRAAHPSRDQRPVLSRSPAAEAQGPRARLPPTAGREPAATRLANGVVDPVTGEGLHGLIAIDATGDGIADFSTWVEVGPDGEIPLVAQISGPACRGLTNLFLYFTVCLGG